jgi:hypothetical protein
VTSNPRFPKNSVGPGGCFCAARIFWAIFVKPVLEAPVVVTVPSSLVAVVVMAGRPAKSSPNSPSCQTRNRWKTGYSPSLINNLRPSRLRSDKAIAASFASGVAKSTYAKLSKNKPIVQNKGENKIPTQSLLWVQHRSEEPSKAYVSS